MSSVYGESVFIYKVRQGGHPGHKNQANQSSMSTVSETTLPSTEPAETGTQVDQPAPSGILETTERDEAPKRSIVVLLITLVPILFVFFTFIGITLSTNKTTTLPSSKSDSVKTTKGSKLVHHVTPTLLSILPKKTILLAASFFLVALLSVAFMVVLQNTSPPAVADPESPEKDKALEVEPEETSWRWWLFGLMVTGVLVAMVAASVWYWRILQPIAREREREKLILSNLLGSTPKIVPDGPSIGDEMTENTYDFHSFFAQFHPKTPHQVTKRQYYTSRMLILTAWIHRARQHPNYSTITLDEDENHLFTMASDGHYPNDDSSMMLYLPLLGDHSTTLSEGALKYNLAHLTMLLYKVMDQMGMQVDNYPKLKKYCRDTLMNVSGEDIHEVMNSKTKAEQIKE